MRTIKLGKTDLTVPVIAVGCMRLAGHDAAGAERFVKTAVESGAYFFDHADIYGGGRCEEIFGEAIGMNPAVREKIILQSKCGIYNGTYDFSKEHILSSVDGSLRRLKTDYLDVLLLHRPDALMEPEEVAEAFDILYDGGKVLNFGVSNQNPGHIRLLSKYIKQPISVNQLQFGIAHASLVSEGTNVNTPNDFSTVKDGGVLDFCRLNDITIQPWSPMQYGFIEGTFINNPKFAELNKKIDEIAERYGVSNTTIAIAWILRHPARMQPVTGTMRTERLLDSIKAADIEITRGEWYEIYRAAGYPLP